MIVSVLGKAGKEEKTLKLGSEGLDWVEIGGAGLESDWVQTSAPTRANVGS